MSRQAIRAANKVWKQLVAEAEATSDGKFVVRVAVGDVSLISFALGCALGMELALEEQRGQEDV